MKKFIKIVLCGVATGLVISAAIFFAKFYLQGKLPMGVKVAGVDVSLKTPTEAIKLLNAVEEKYVSQPIVFKLGERKIEIKPKDFGIDILVEDTVSTIQRMDFQKQNPFEIINNAKKVKGVEVLYSLDKEKLISTLEKAFELNKLYPSNARYTSVSGNKLEIVEEKEGSSLDTKKLYDDIGNLAAGMMNKEIEILLYEQRPVITKAELEKFKAEFEDKLKTTINIKFGKKTWQFKPLKNLDFIKFEQRRYIKLPYIGEVLLTGEHIPQETESVVQEIKITIDREKLNEFINNEISQTIEREAEAVSISKNKEGKIIITGKGSDGIKVQRGVLKQSLELAINEKITEVEIQTGTIKAPVVISQEVREMGIKELVAIGHTSFYGSPANRVHNIKTGMEKLNGTVINAGQIFSFNETIGPVDDTTGYKKELVITKKGTIPEYGGGLCQVSTTLYRAAIFAGLPIVERAPHSYVVSYYAQILGDGLDATVYIGGQDLKFSNDTGFPILIQGYVEDNNAYFKFYGTSDGRSVKLDGPYKSNYRYPPKEVLYTEDPSVAPGEKRLVEKKNTGFDALWYRTITRPEGTETKEEILSRYRAGQEKYLVAPGSASNP